jgi:hypothetical protein
MTTTTTSSTKFFQIETKFVVGNYYEFLRVKMPKWGTYASNLETCDEIGTIIPNSTILLGKYVSSLSFGYGDNRSRCDTFINYDNKLITNYLLYDGTTRYREVESYFDTRINYLSLIEGVGDGLNKNGKNEHINKYLLDQELSKEICSFMGPNHL